MSSIVNNFAENSVTMNAGSTMNGDVHIENVNQGKDEGNTAETTNDSEQKQLKSPLRLSRKKGTKIDFIRVMNAWSPVQHRLVRLQQRPVEFDVKQCSL